MEDWTHVLEWGGTEEGSNIIKKKKDILFSLCLVLCYAVTYQLQNGFTFCCDVPDKARALKSKTFRGHKLWSFDELVPCMSNGDHVVLRRACEMSRSTKGYSFMKLQWGQAQHLHHHRTCTVHKPSHAPQSHGHARCLTGPKPLDQKSESHFHLRTGQIDFDSMKV